MLGNRFIIRFTLTIILSAIFIANPNYYYFFDFRLGGLGGGGGGEEEGDEDFGNIFQETNLDDAGRSHEIKKISISPGFRFFRLGPEYIDEEYFDRTPIPLYQQAVPILDYDVFLEKSPDEILVIVRMNSTDEVY